MTRQRSVLNFRTCPLDLRRERSSGGGGDQPEHAAAQKPERVRDEPLTSSDSGISLPAPSE